MIETDFFPEGDILIGPDDPAPVAAEEPAEAVSQPAAPVLEPFECGGCKKQVDGKEHGPSPWFNFCRECRGEGETDE